VAIAAFEAAEPLVAEIARKGRQEIWSGRPRAAVPTRVVALPTVLLKTDDGELTAKS